MLPAITGVSLRDVLVKEGRFPAGVADNNLRVFRLIWFTHCFTLGSLIHEPCHGLASRGFYTDAAKKCVPFYAETGDLPWWKNSDVVLQSARLSAEKRKALLGTGL